MNDLEKYHDNNPVIEQKVVSFEIPSETDGESTSNLIKGVWRRWPIVLVTFVLICAIGWHQSFPISFSAIRTLNV